MPLSKEHPMKKWSISIFALVLIVMVGIAAINYIVDPFGYFVFQSGNFNDLKTDVDKTYCIREFKANHIRYFGNNYDAFLIGGSKAGSYRPEKLKELDGLNYYNMFVIGGSMYEYWLDTSYVLKHAHPKKIILSISGGEVNKEIWDQKDMTFYIPALFTGKSRTKEKFDFLLKDVKKSYDLIQHRTSEKVHDEIATGGELVAQGNRDLTHYYESIKEDAERFVRRYVLEFYKIHMETLFKTNLKSDHIDTTINYLKDIKGMCDAAGVELIVIVAPSFIGELAEFESTYYRDFLAEIALTTPYWDFSGYNELNLNPYNYYNEGHFLYEMADLVIDTMNGKKSYPGFGEYVTRENAIAHIDARQADYDRLKALYEKEGPDALLQGQEDSSCLLNR